MRRAPLQLTSAPSRRARRSLRRPRERGAVLIVALLLAAIIAVSLGSYLNLNLQSSRLAQRSFNGFAALNLAEAGAEEAVWSFNRAQRGSSDAWTSWRNNGTSAWTNFTFDLGPNVAGSTKVYVDRFDPAGTSRPKIYAQSSVGSASETQVTKMIEVTLRRRSLFASGLVAKDAIVFAGAVSSVDSWNSDPDGSSATAPIPYSAAVRTDNGTVGSTSVANSAVLINQANIWGYVATGGGTPEVGTNGTVRGTDTPADMKIDPRRVSTDFNADFDSVLVPVDGTVLAELPEVLGVAGTKTKWRIASIHLTGKQTLTILGDVTLVLTASTGDAVSLAGQAEIIIPDGSSLTLYTAADVKIAGNGLTNRNVQPISCQLYGTSTTPAGQDFQITGNGSLCAVVYAPNGDVTLNGNGDIMGSVVARKIKLTGNAAFHYDESLATRDANDPFTIAKWRELTSAADRALYAPLFEGW